MKDTEKMKEQLIEELNELRGRLALLEKEMAVAAEGQEGRERQLAQELALQRVREEVWSMRGSDDIEKVLRVLKEELEKQEVLFSALGMNVVDTEERSPSIRTRNMTRNGEGWVPTPERGRDIVLRIWEEGKTAYRRDLLKEDPYQERDLIEKSFGRSVRSVLDVPIAQGTLALNSTEPNAFSEVDIAFMKDLAGVLSEGLQRQKDLRELIRQKEMLEEKNRLFRAFQSIGQSTLSHLDMDGILDTLAVQIVKAGIFRSLTISLVDAARNEYEVVRNYISRDEDGNMAPGKKLSSALHDNSVIGRRYSLDDPVDLAARAFRRGEVTVIKGWGNSQRADREAAIEKGDPHPKYKVSYFIPVKQKDHVLAMLATGSNGEEEEVMRSRIEAMQPLLDQVAIALDHSRLIREIQQEITERKQMEEELIRTQRLRAVGELSAGVSHNLNNTLTGVLMPAQLLKLKVDDPEILEDVDAIIAAGQRASDLVHRLHLSVRGFAEDNLQPIPVNEVIQEAEQTARPRWKDESEFKGLPIEIVTQLEEVSWIRGTRSRLHDILTNLLFNAVDAMPQGGTITIHTQLVDDRVQLTFTDTGIGMDEATKMRVFEPFFTIHYRTLFRRPF